MNRSDSERIAGELEDGNYKLTHYSEEADIVVINTCSVRAQAVKRCFNRIKNLQKQRREKGTKIILTGCVLPVDRKNIESYVDEIKDHAPLENKCSSIFKEEAYVPIMTGCNNFCSYCVVPYLRGREISRKPEKVLKDVENKLKEGYNQITLLGQNVNSYKGYDKNNNPVLFPKLLQTVENIEGDFSIYFLTSHPKDLSDELIDTIAHSKKITKNIHLPVQSGDDEILRKMNRNYTLEDYKELIEKMRERIKDLQITTDIIVGFPGEIREQFQNTLNLVREIGFKQIYVGIYSPRPGTAAADLANDVPFEEKKRRKQKILECL